MACRAGIATLDAEQTSDLVLRQTIEIIRYVVDEAFEKPGSLSCLRLIDGYDLDERFAGFRDDERLAACDRSIFTKPKRTCPASSMPRRAHLLIWSAIFPRKLSETARHLIEDRSNELVFSAVGIWEIAIKRELKELDSRLDPLLLRLALLENDYTELAITSRHAASVRALPQIHKDPFDRLLVAQALCEGIVLLTSDARLEPYPAPIRLV